METKDFVLGFAAGKAQGSGGGDEPSGTIQITVNGNHNVKKYETAAVNVPNSYTASDEGKVVNNGSLVSQTARPSQITENGTYDTTTNNSVQVNVPTGQSVPHPPSTYQEVEYIGFSGTQFVTPTIPFARYDRVCVEFEIGASAGTGEQCLCGYGGNWEIYYSETSITYFASCSSLYSPTVTRNTKLITWGSISFATTSLTFYIGRYRTSGSMYPLEDAKIYRVYTGIYDGDHWSYKSYFVPCYRKSDNVAGFYDCINEVFYTNDGTGDFGKGSDVN